MTIRSVFASPTVLLLIAEKRETTVAPSPIRSLRVVRERAEGISMVVALSVDGEEGRDTGFPVAGVLAGDAGRLRDFMVGCIGT